MLRRHVGELNILTNDVCKQKKLLQHLTVCYKKGDTTVKHVQTSNQRLCRLEDNINIHRKMQGEGCGLVASGPNSGLLL
jgi:hypothetical protein